MVKRERLFELASENLGFTIMGLVLFFFWTINNIIGMFNLYNSLPDKSLENPQVIIIIILIIVSFSALYFLIYTIGKPIYRYFKRSKRGEDRDSLRYINVVYTADISELMMLIGQFLYPIIGFFINGQDIF